MGYVLIVSFPMVVFFIILSFGCYALGRHKGQQEGRAMAAQELGINPARSQSTMAAVADGVMAAPAGTPPPPAPPHQYPAFPSHHPNPIYLKQQNGINVV